jgi:hypothetical protein
LVVKPKENRQFGKPRRRWEDNIGMALWEVEWEGVDWMQLAQDRNQWRACEHGNEPSDSIKGGEFLD